MKQQQIAAKLANYEAMQVKVKMMEDDGQNGKVATDLLSQFLETGFVRQDDDGTFTVPGISGEKKFKPFGELG